MVTKPPAFVMPPKMCSVLAKIHMVTKLSKTTEVSGKSSVLAKIHTVTKLREVLHDLGYSSVLAKIHMVTKP